MKRLITSIVLMMMVSAIAMSQPITMEQAQQKAERFLQNKSGSKRLKAVTSGKKLAPGQSGSTTALYYAFNRGENEGYVLVAGDDKIEPVLGYTDEGEFDYNSIPDNMRYWLDDYAAYVKYLQSNPEVERKKVPTHPVIDEMLTCRWNQGYPYNNECPMYFTLGRSVTGCVATAMAQIMYYQRAKSVDEVQQAIPGYTAWTTHATYGQLEVEGIPDGAPIDWANMLDNYNSGGTAKQQLAVAQLMHYCGVSVQMDYTNSASGAQSYMVADALNKYFGYSTAKYVSRGNYTDDSWDALIYKELEEGRVVYLSGANSQAGHAFVCDGYDGNHCYHINWGWGGQSNGHFLLSSLNPASQGIGGSGDGYNQYQDAVIGCEPDNYGEKEIPFANATAKKLCQENFDSNGDGKFTYGEAALVTDIGTVFQGKRFAAFTELYHFTGLTHLANDAFSGCTTLASIKLPKHLKSIGSNAFNGCRSLKEIKIPDYVESIGEGAFSGCRNITIFAIPFGISQLEANTFNGCSGITSFDLPISVQQIGSQCFANCTKLTEFTIHNVSSTTIPLGENVFEGIDLSGATLNVEEGTKSAYSNADQWKDFGTIYEKRSLSGGNYASIALNKDFYIYNEGTGKYLTKGEAYNTQAVVSADAPMRFQLRRTSSMGTNVYYLYSNDTGNDGHIFFRTTTDGNVGNGVKACFVDGDNSHTSDKTSWWQIVEVGENLYTIQIPSDVTNYNKDQYLGIQPTHTSNAASPTYGAYFDVKYTDNPLNCQWRFITYDEEAMALYNEAQVLKKLLDTASSKHVEASFEQAVYDDHGSTSDQIVTAQHKLRKKLNFIDFKDKTLRSVALDNWDLDGDGEISYTEASKVADFGYWSLYNQPFVDLSDLQYFTKCEYLYGNTFQNCKTLTKITLPKSISTIYYQVFQGCTKLTSIVLPEHITLLGEKAFSGCPALKEVTVLNPDPSTIELGSNVFTTSNIKTATLYVPYGSKELYANANVWKDFGTIEEVRGSTMPDFSPITAGVKGYVFNLGERKYVTGGEAYGTQAIVGNTGYLYEFRRSSNMADGVYYLYSDQAGGNHTLFRTSTDEKVGSGVKACFVDGSVGATAYWQTTQSDGNIYTLQVPKTDSNYTAGEYLGVQTSHKSDAESPTYGLYWDIASSAGKSIQWGFISQADMVAAKAIDEQAEKLKNLLINAKAKSIDAIREQAIYDNPNSTLEEIEDAILLLRAKLGYISFGDSRAKTISVNNFDTDDDGELSLEEAAAVTNIGTAFRSSINMKSFEELRYFTGLTELKAEAFYGATSMTSLYIPENVKSIGTKAFTACNALKYIAILTPEVIEAPDAGITSKFTIFVPKDLMDAYASSETWKNCTIMEYTGAPMVTVVDETKVYGRSNPKFTYTLTGAPINGEPLINIENVPTSESGAAYAEGAIPVGTYTIKVSTGSITSENLILVDGKFTIDPAELTITARNAKRIEGEANPEFKLSYKGFKNSEKAETALTVQPIIECDATPDSPAGEYEIRVSGAVAPNYTITYVNGTLTVEASTGIESITSDELNSEKHVIYDLQGRRVKQPTRGIYIIDGKKTVVK